MCVSGRYHTDPSGTFMRYDAKAIGSGSEAAQSELQDKWYKVIGPAALTRRLADITLANRPSGSPKTDTTGIEASDGGEA